MIIVDTGLHPMRGFTKADNRLLLPGQEVQEEYTLESKYWNNEHKLTVLPIYSLKKDKHILPWTNDPNFITVEEIKALVEMEKIQPALTPHGFDNMTKTELEIVQKHNQQILESAKGKLEKAIADEQMGRAVMRLYMISAGKPPAEGALVDVGDWYLDKQWCKAGISEEHWYTHKCKLNSGWGVSCVEETTDKIVCRECKAEVPKSLRGAALSQTFA